MRLKANQTSPGQGLNSRSEKIMNYKSEKPELRSWHSFRRSERSTSHFAYLKKFLYSPFVILVNLLHPKPSLFLPSYCYLSGVFLLVNYHFFCSFNSIVILYVAKANGFAMLCRSIALFILFLGIIWFHRP